MRHLPMCLLLVCVACGAGAPSPTNDSAADLRSEQSNPNPMLYPEDSKVDGRSLARWSELLWTWIYSAPIDHVPLLDPTGADCAVNQNGPVWFLAAVPGSSLGTDVTRTCTIPRNKSVMVQLASTLNDYPCPDPNFHPAPGQSLYDFLISPIKPLFDGETGFSVTLDGVPIIDPLSYRFTSDDVFHFKGNATLNPNFDPCVTGKRQEGVTDGFYLMFKPLSPGDHVIVIDGHDMEGVPVRLTHRLTVL